MALVVLVAVVIGAGSPPKSGASDERLFSIAGRLKCLQCVGESVAASQAPLAVQFRDEIRTQMRSGKTDDEILNFFADRYGQEVLLTPPSSGIGGLVWVIPVVAVAAALLGLALVFRRWRSERVDRHASDEDQELVAEALADRHARALDEPAGAADPS
jgi:cytochrome c-type biogenesis protein CcmH